MESQLTNHLSKSEPGLVLTHDAFLFQDREHELKKTQFQVEHGIKTINEIREEEGYDAIEGGDVPLIPAGLQTLEMAVLGEGAEEKKNILLNARY